jgi:predicted RNase H-like nuclease (RuvC/YqgF family)
MEGNEGLLMPEYDTKMEVELLKRDVSNINRLCGKYDETIDRMKDVAVNLSRIVSLQEQKQVAQEKKNEEFEKSLEHERDVTDQQIEILHDKIERTEKTILNELKSLSTEVKGANSNMAEKISKLEFWRYTVMGAIVFAAFLLSKFIDIAKILGG